MLMPLHSHFNSILPSHQNSNPFMSTTIFWLLENFLFSSQELFPEGPKGHKSHCFTAFILPIFFSCFCFGVYSFICCYFFKHTNRINALKKGRKARSSEKCCKSPFGRKVFFISFYFFVNFYYFFTCVLRQHAVCQPECF